MRVLRPPQDTLNEGSAIAAKLALYLRSHWLKMPLGLLLRHLAYKAWLMVRGVRDE
jgi:hypothetical protein